MAIQTPLKAIFDENGNVIELGQYTTEILLVLLMEEQEIPPIILVVFW